MVGRMVRRGQHLEAHRDARRCRSEVRKAELVTSERYRARYRDEAGVEHARHCEKVDAQRWLDEATAGIVRGDWVDPTAGKITFAQWWGRWAAAQDWAAGTAATADQVLASIGFGDVPIRSVTENHVRQWMKAQRLPGPKRKRGLAASTRRTRFNYVRMCFAAAVRARLIREHDPTSARSRRRKSPRPDQDEDPHT